MQRITQVVITRKAKNPQTMPMLVLYVQRVFEVGGVVCLVVGGAGRLEETQVLVSPPSRVPLYSSHQMD